MRRWAWPAAALGLLLALLGAVSLGRFPVPLRALLPGADPAAATVLWNIRLPRVGAAMLAGAALAGAGAAFQGLFRNPLASPDLLGVTVGASLGAVLGIVAGLPVPGIQALAFAGGLVAVGCVMLLAAAARGVDDPVLLLVLAGIALGALFGAALSLLKVLADPYNQLPAITFWLLGSLSGVTRTDLWAAAPPAAAGLLLLLLLRWRLNLLALGEDEARSLGVGTVGLRAAAVLGATLATASVTALAGAIGWVGLVVPHAARLLAGPDLRQVLPLSMLLGAAVLLVVDTLARTLAAVEIPLGILTAALGTPAFLALLARRGGTA